MVPLYFVGLQGIADQIGEGVTFQPVRRGNRSRTADLRDVGGPAEHGLNRPGARHINQLRIETVFFEELHVMSDPERRIGIGEGAVRQPDSFAGTPAKSSIAQMNGAKKRIVAASSQQLGLFIELYIRPPRPLSQAGARAGMLSDPFRAM
jgi:hypothetical protein